MTLTETKNFLLEQTNKLKDELKIINENEKLLIKNNSKLQHEVSLLSKNKKLLIEIDLSGSTSITFLNDLIFLLIVRLKLLDDIIC